MCMNGSSLPRYQIVSHMSIQALILVIFDNADACVIGVSKL